MINLILGENVSEFEKSVNEVVNLVETRAGEIDRNNEMDKLVIEELFENGLMGVMAPTRHGGLGLSYVDACRIIEKLATVSPSVAHSVFVHNMAVNAILKFGNEEQKDRYLPSLVSEKLGAVAITEPSGGSDVANAVRLRAVKGGNEYILNGTKMFITNATHAEFFITTARTGSGKEGLTTFIVEREDGVKVKKLDTGGMRGSGLGTIRFVDAEVPADNILVKEGKGLKVALSTLSPSRLLFSAVGLGIAEGCFNHALSYAKKRESFGNKIVSFQAIQFMLADIATGIEVTRAFISHVAELADSNDITVLASMAKLRSAELAKKASDIAVELHGGYGILSNTYVERAYRDAKTLDIAEGTSEMMKLIISRALL